MHKTLLGAALLALCAALAWAEALSPGAACPEIKAEGWINGEAPKPEDWKDKVRVIEFWAFW